MKVQVVGQDGDGFLDKVRRLGFEAAGQLAGLREPRFLRALLASHRLNDAGLSMDG